MSITRLEDAKRGYEMASQKYQAEVLYGTPQSIGFALGNLKKAWALLRQEIGEHVVGDDTL